MMPSPFAWWPRPGRSCHPAAPPTGERLASTQRLGIEVAAPRSSESVPRGRSRPWRATRRPPFPFVLGVELLVRGGGGPPIPGCLGGPQEGAGHALLGWPGRGGLVGAVARGDHRGGEHHERAGAGGNVVHRQPSGRGATLPLPGSMPGHPAPLREIGLRVLWRDGPPAPVLDDGEALEIRRRLTAASDVPPPRLRSRRDRARTRPGRTPAILRMRATRRRRSSHPRRPRTGHPSGGSAAASPG